MYMKNERQAAPWYKWELNKAKKKDYSGVFKDSKTL